MAFRKITTADMLGKGNMGRADTPGVSTAEMQRIMDELPREVIAPAFNELSTELEAETAAADIGAAAPAGVTADPAPATGGHASVQSVMQGLRNYTDAKVLQTGAADMTQAMYDPTHEEKPLLPTTGDGSDVTAAFTEAAQDADIQTGEKLSVLFGKIKKRFSVITTTFAKLSNLAYGNEVDTGLTWLDGKKVYRKSVKITPSQYTVSESGTPTTYTATVTNLTSGVNEICMLQAMLVTPTGYYLPLGAKRNGASDFGGYVSATIQNNIVKLEFGTGERPLDTERINYFTVICEYTKI